MHEFSLCQYIKKLAIQAAADRHKAKISKVTLAIGQLSCIEPKALQQAFDIVMKESIAEGASLILNTIVAKAKCLHCGTEYGMKDWLEHCPSCGEYRRDILSGEECNLESIEAE